MKNYQKNQNNFFTENHKMPHSKPKRIRKNEIQSNYSDIIKNIENYYFEFSFNILSLLFGFFVVYNFAVPAIPASYLLGLIAAASLKIELYKKEE